jgi:hypothetical protein
MIIMAEEYNEFLIRVQASAKPKDSWYLPSIPGWEQTDSSVDNELGVRYATYSQIVSQPVTGDGPNIDALSDDASEVKTSLENQTASNVSCEVQIHLISPPIAVWNS